jgi:hypothetical protein
MHVSSALNAIKKWGTFNSYKEAYETYIEQKETSKEAKANMQLFATTASEGEKADKKGTEKTSKRLLVLDSFSEKLPNHGNRDSHVNTFSLL